MLVMCMKSIHINVPDDLLEIIDKMVESGLYKNRTEVIHQALINYEPIRHILRRKQIEIIEKITKEVSKQITLNPHSHNIVDDT